MDRIKTITVSFLIISSVFCVQAFSVDCNYIQFLAEKDFKRTDNIIGDSVVAYEKYKKKDFYQVPQNRNYILMKNLPSHVSKCRFPKNGNPKFSLDTCREISGLNNCLKNINLTEEKKIRFFDFLKSVQPHLYNQGDTQRIIKQLELTTELASPQVKSCQKEIGKELEFINSAFKENPTFNFPGDQQTSHDWSFSMYEMICSSSDYKNKISCLKDISITKKYYLSSFSNINSACKDYETYMSTELRSCLREATPSPNEAEGKKLFADRTRKIAEIKEKNPNNWEEVLYQQDFFNQGFNLLDMRTESEMNILQTCIASIQTKGTQDELNPEPRNSDSMAVPR